MAYKAHLLDADYTIEDGTAVIRLFCEQDGEPLLARVTDFQPYFYILPADREQALKRIEEEKYEADEFNIIGYEEDTLTDVKDEREVIRVYVQIPPHVPKAKDALRDWEEVEDAREYDIPFYKRFLINNDLRPPSQVMIEGDEVEDDRFEGKTVVVDEITQGDQKDVLNHDVLAFDLEVYDDTIIMCSFYGDDYEKVLALGDDTYSHDYVENVSDEKKLLERMMAIVAERDPNVVVGYNTDEFDFDVLRDRCQDCGLELKMGRLDERMTFRRRGRFSGASLKGRVHIDLYAFVANVLSMTLQSETLDLDSVAEELLGENKEDMDWEAIKQNWKNRENLDELAQYALKDSELAYRISESLTPEIFSLSVLTGMVPFDTCRTSYGQLVENFLIREAYQEDRLVPNRPHGGIIGKRRREGAYTGGFVYEPEKGLHENIALFDFRSLYPTIIVAHNISPDVLDMEDCDDRLEVEVEESGNTYTFCQDEKGFIPDILENLVSERYEIKDVLYEKKKGSQQYRDLDNRQAALKILSNAFYGYLGYASARWYSRGCAEATTYLGRKYIHDTIDIAEDMGFEVVYGDTDSVLIKGDSIEEKADAFQDRVNSQLPAFMELELEGMFVRGLFTYTESGRGAKKKYALLGQDGSVKITGFEQVRRDWSQLAKDTQENVIRHVLDQDVEGAAQVVKDTIERLKQGDVPLDQLKIYTGMSKKPENYKSKSPHVEAAKKAKKRGMEISPGDTIDYVITKGPGTISDRAEVTRFAQDYDPQYYIDKQILPVSIRVLKVFDYTAEQLKGNGKQSGLGKFT